MKLLAIDTATEACSVSLRVGDQQLDRYVELDRGHAEQILPMVDELLAEAGTALTALDAIAFGRGPGGFTGVRLAASVAQGLAFGAGLGVVAVSTLATVAMRALQLVPAAQRILVVNDARMREVYWADIPIEAGLPGAAAEHVNPPGLVQLPTRVTQPWVAAGRGLRAWPELAMRCQAAGAALQPDLLPRASEVLLLAQVAVAAGHILAPESAIPVYVRDRVAEPPL